MGMYGPVYSKRIYSTTDNSRDLLRGASAWAIAWSFARWCSHERVELEGDILSPHHPRRDCSMQLLLLS